MKIIRCSLCDEEYSLEDFKDLQGNCRKCETTVNPVAISSDKVIMINSGTLAEVFALAEMMILTMPLVPEFQARASLDHQRVFYKTAREVSSQVGFQLTREENSPDFAIEFETKKPTPILMVDTKNEWAN